MMTGIPDIVKCPSCGYLQQQWTLVSGNTLGAHYYSDGTFRAPMLPQYPHFVMCPACGIFFKICESVIEVSAYSNEMDYFESEDSRIPFVSFLTVDEYYRALETGLYNSGNTNSNEYRSDMLSLRLSLWRAMNHQVHEEGSVTIIETFDIQKAEPEKRELYEKNCRAILSTLSKRTYNASYDERLLIRAELHRNLGEFNNCKKYLSRIRRIDSFQSHISLITAACEEGKTATVEVIEKSLKSIQNDLTIEREPNSVWFLILMFLCGFIVAPILALAIAESSNSITALFSVLFSDPIEPMMDVIYLLYCILILLFLHLSNMLTPKQNSIHPKNKPDIDVALINCINAVKDLKEVKRIPYASKNEKEQDTVHLLYPAYPPQISKLLFALYSEYGMGDYATLRDKPIGELSEQEIGGFLWAIGNGERFFAGLTERYIKNGTYLELLLKLKEFRDKKEERFSF